MTISDATSSDARIPVTVVTGFLSSGKTTLLNHVLIRHHGHRISVIENEFGEIGIDHELLVKADEEIFEMNNGCICCTVRGDLIRILGQLARRRDKFDYALIETTGLADPGPVAQTFFVDEEVREQYRLDGIVTLVDARHVGHPCRSNTHFRPVGRAAQAAVCKTAEAIPARDSISPGLGIERHTLVFQTGAEGALPSCPSISQVKPVRRQRARTVEGACARPPVSLPHSCTYSSANPMASARPQPSSNSQVRILKVCVVFGLVRCLAAVPTRKTRGREPKSRAGSQSGRGQTHLTRGYPVAIENWVGVRTLGNCLCWGSLPDPESPGGESRFRFGWSSTAQGVWLGSK